MLLYYITDRRQFPGSAPEQRVALLQKISEAARCGVDFIQLREKDLSARELLRLARDAQEKIVEATGFALPTRHAPRATRLLVNSRIDVALACGTDGVHLRADDISPAEARVVFSKAAMSGDWKPTTENFLIAVSCHAEDEVARAASDGADLVVFAPVFEKSGRQCAGIKTLYAACRATAKASTPEASPQVHIPVLALGGVTLENARRCVEAGAAGIAGIRLFQDNDVAEVVARLRRLA
jgi:thiamine-phosphate pyrophosphorylase